jgi:hypothetical protein
MEVLVTRLSQEAFEDLKRLKVVKKAMVTDYEGEAEGEKIDRLVINVESDQAAPEVLDYMASKQCRVVSVNIRGPTLEDLFMYFTGEK